MIEIYLEIGKTLDATNLLSWIDTAPYKESGADKLPAAYISVDKLQPINTLGVKDSFAEVDFTVEYRFEPSDGDSTSGSLSPSMLSFGKHLEVVRDCRKALFDLNNEAIYATTLTSEAQDVEQKEHCVIRQQWRCLTSLWYAKLEKVPMPPLEFQAHIEVDTTKKTSG